MKVDLISYTPDAISLLLFTKDTRLQGAQSIDDIKNWPESKQLEHLEYMRNTIQSSWEFVEYVFHIQDVSRAFTHQLVRTRTGSYAQESQRTVDVSDHDVLNTTGSAIFDIAAQNVMKDYKNMIDKGVPVQDARGILPTNVLTNIIAKFDLRTLHNMALVRLCTRTQGEYQNVFRVMRDAVVNVHPWAKDFIKARCAWDGTCEFPMYKACPIQDMTYKAHKEKLDIIQMQLETIQHQATPIAKDGKTM